MTREEQLLRELGPQSRAALIPPVDAARRSELLEGFQAALRQSASSPEQPARATPPSRRRRWIALAGGAAVATLALALAALLTLPGRVALKPQTPTRFIIETHTSNRTGQEGAWIQAAREPTRLRFADGTRMTLGTGGRVHVLEARNPSIRIRLEQGELQAAVVPATGLSWTVEAGPYAVRVVGTRFTVRWWANQTRLSVEVTRGQVRVVGKGLASEGVSVSGGRRLDIDGPSARLTLRQTNVSSGRVEISPERTPDEKATRSQPPHPKAVATAVPPSTSKTPLKKRWRAAFDGGRYAEIVRDARTRGFKGLLQRLDRGSLWILANACRYRRLGAWSRAALLAVRRRFARSAQATQAAYLLGRVHIERLGQPAAACVWFQRYLQERPKGPLAEEALGRLVNACLKAGRTTLVRRAAARYLKRYPRGIFRSVAQTALKKTGTRDNLEVPP